MPMICNRSFLSAYVKRIIVEIWNEKESAGTKELCSLSYEEVSNLFDETADKVTKNNLLNTKEDFESAIAKLCPLFQLTKSLKYTPDDIENLSDVCSRWMDVEKCCITKWFHIMAAVSFPIENLHYLQIFAALERALGNVFLLKGKQCPFLLRDLVQSQELEDTFGKSNLKMLKLFLGGPLSLNLRNLFWHGFVSEDEVPSIFYHFLIFLVVKLSKHIYSHYLLPDIKMRPLVRKSAEMELLKQRFVGLELEVKLKLEEIKKSFGSSPFIPPAMLSVFNYSLDLHSSGRYGDCVMTLLPRIEHVLRCRFAMRNDCPDRMVTAQSSDYYTTMDHVLEEKSSDGRRNKLREDLDDGVLVIIMDLFTLTHGLRLRDHLSHGEMSSRDVDENLAAVIMSLAVIVAHDGGVDVDCPEDNKDCDKRQSSNSHGTTISWLRDHVTDYEALFHPHSFTKRDVTHCCQSCADLDQSLLSRDLSTAPPTQLEEQYTKLSFMTSHYVEASLPGIQDGTSSCDEKSSTVTDVLRKKLVTLYRSHPNDVIVRQMASEMTHSMDNITQQLRHGSRQYDAKLMRSRKRKNFCRFLECIPVFSIAITCLSSYLLLLMHNHDLLDATDPRKLKKILQICENSTTYTSPEVNKWDECVKCIMNLCEILPL